MPANLIVEGSAILREGVHLDRMPPDLEYEIGQVTAMRERDGVSYVDLLFPKQGLHLHDLPAECFHALLIGQRGTSA